MRILLMLALACASGLVIVADGPVVRWIEGSANCPLTRCG